MNTAQLNNSIHVPLMCNDEQISGNVAQAMIQHLGGGFSKSLFPSMGSEDFSHLSNAVNAPCCFLNYGGVDQHTWDEARNSGRVEQLLGHIVLCLPQLFIRPWRVRLMHMQLRP